MNNSSKRLYRSTSNKMIAGICGGIAEYLNLDPTVVRVAWILLSVLPLIPGIIIYVIAWVIIPKKNDSPSAKTSSTSMTASAFFGFLFIAIGSLIFLANLDVLDWEEWWEFSWEYALPLLLIAIGVFFITRPSRPGEKPESHAETGKTAEPQGASSLRRSRHDRKIGGVCGGLAAYLRIDSSIVRVAFVFFTLWPFGLGAVVYAIMLLVIPDEEAQTVGQS